MPIILQWFEGAWHVSVKGSVEILTTTSYRKAYFWIKYKDEIDSDFITNFVLNT